MNNLALIAKFHSTLPVVREWIDSLLNENSSHAVPISTLNFQQLNTLFSKDLLDKAKVVLTTEKMPFPPLSSMGLTEFAEMEKMNMDGITYRDTFFIKDLHKKKESLYFHELIHVIQWARLGIDNFLLAYGIGLMQFGYHNSPLEKMAYSFQADFNRDAALNNVEELVQQDTDAIWSVIAPMFQKA